MSAVMQKRRVKAKATKFDEKQLSTYKPDNLRYHQHIKNFNAFETNFNKNFIESNLGGLKITLSNFYKSFKKNEFLIDDLSRHREGFEQSTDDILLIQRSNSVIKLLTEYFLNKRNYILQSKSTPQIVERLSAESQEATILAIKTIKAFIMVNPVFGKLLAHLPMFIETLLQLTLQNYKLYFKQTLRILEALIRFNPETITQDLYPILSDILSNLPKKYFGRFSRVLALLLLENTEKPDTQEFTMDYSDNKLNKLHLFMLSRPNFLESYTTVLESLTKTIQSLISINSDNLSKTLNYLKESKLIKDSAVDLRALKPIFEQCKSVKNLISEVFASEFIIKFVVSKSNITEIFFILSSLLAGRRKFDVQSQLNEMNFFNRVIEPFFEILFHPNLELEDPEDVSNANNPLSSARVQFIKIMINFCEGSPSNAKNLFISSAEKAVLEREISSEQTGLSNLGQLKSLSNLGTLKANIFEKVEKKGLLHKIIILLRRTNVNSSYYSWLSSFIQTSLKQTDETEHIFVAHTGLLAYLVDLIVRNQLSIPSNIQATFDLIAEIFKFNPYNMIFLDKLCKGFGWNASLLNRIEQNIVNSNVFVRSAIVSYERILMKMTDIQENQAEDQFSLFSILFSKKTKFFESLIHAATTQAMNYDNLCCINTALVIALILEQRDSLESCLNNSLKNSRRLHEVLDIWNKYYHSNTKIHFTLELTTSIKFVYFQDIMNKIELFLYGAEK